MNPLKEEIEQTISQCRKVRQSSEGISNVIISIIENRIDSRYNEFKLNRNRKEVIKTEFGEGYIQAFKDIKEMLK